MNQVRKCATPGCRDNLTHAHVKSVGLGGTITIGYTCNGCVSQTPIFETSSKYELGSTNKISIAVQVAFIILSCTHITCYETLKHVIGIDVVKWCDF